MAFAKKTWKDRIAEFPTRRRLTKEDNTSELVTVAREEGTLSQEGDAFSADNMNDLENRIDKEFTAVNGKLTTELSTKKLLVTKYITSACTIQIPDYKSYKLLVVIIKGDGNNGISICIPTIMMDSSNSGIPFSLYSTNGSITISQGGYTIVAQGEIVTGDIKVSYLNVASWNQAQVSAYGIN